MRAGGSKAKGASFERDVAKVIVRAFKHKKIEKKHCFRTPMSGGHLYAKDKHPSDLVIRKRLLRYLPVTIECKHYRSINYMGLIGPVASGGIFSWIRQVLAANKKTPDRLPMVVMKQNRDIIYCCFPLNQATELFDGFKAYRVIQFRNKKKNWILMPFERFLEKVVVCVG